MKAPSTKANFVLVLFRWHNWSLCCNTYYIFNNEQCLPGWRWNCLILKCSSLQPEDFDVAICCNLLSTPSISRWWCLHTNKRNKCNEVKFIKHKHNNWSIQADFRAPTRLRPASSGNSLKQTQRRMQHNSVRDNGRA